MTPGSGSSSSSPIIDMRNGNGTTHDTKGWYQSAAAKSRELGRPFDESDARQRLTVHDLQRLADEIQHEIAIVDADSDTRRMKEDEQVTENAQALADEQAQRVSRRRQTSRRPSKRGMRRRRPIRPLIKQHFAKCARSPGEPRRNTRR